MANDDIAARAAAAESRKQLLINVFSRSDTSMTPADCPARSLGLVSDIRTEQGIWR
jgi:hypothetical protein